MGVRVPWREGVMSGTVPGESHGVVVTLHQSSGLQVIGVGSSMTSVVKAVSGLLDLSAASVADLPHLDEAALEAAVDRLIQPCGGGSDSSTVIGGHVRMWQNYRTEQ